MSRPLSRPRAVMQMLGTLLVLAGLLGGVPALLVQWGHWPLNGAPSWEDIRDLPNAVVSDEAILAVLTLALWASWAVFAGSVVAEAAAQFRGRTRAPLHLGGPLQRLAGNLVGSLVLCIGSLGSTASASMVMPASMASPLALPAASGTPASVVLPDAPPADAGAWAATHAFDPNGAGTFVLPDWAAPAKDGSAGGGAGAGLDEALARAGLDQGGTGRGGAAPTPAPSPQAMPTVEVQRGDTPWSLAEAHLGDGMRWREIWDLNQGRTQADGGMWSAPDQAIRPGWQLVLPADATGATGTTGTTAPTAPTAPIQTIGGNASPAGQQGPATPATTAATTGTTGTGGTADPSAPASQVTVQPGDHFWKLAKEQLTSAWGRVPTDAEIVPHWQALIDANRHLLAPPHDPDLIYPGQVFTLVTPPADPTRPAPPPAAPAPDTGAPTEGSQDGGQAPPAEGTGSDQTDQTGGSGSDTGSDQTGTGTGSDQTDPSQGSDQDQDGTGSPTDQTGDDGQPSDTTGTTEADTGAEPPPDQSHDEGAGADDPTSGSGGAPPVETGSGDDGRATDTTDTTEAPSTGTGDDQGSEAGTGVPEGQPGGEDQAPPPDGSGPGDGSDTSDDAGTTDPGTEPGTEGETGTAEPGSDTGTGTGETGSDTGTEPGTEGETGTAEPGAGTDTGDGTGGDPSDSATEGQDGAESPTGEAGDGDPTTGDGTGTDDQAGSEDGSAVPPSSSGDRIEEPPAPDEASNQQTDSADEGSDILPIGLMAGGMAVAGVVVILDRRRRAQQRHRGRGRRAPMPTGQLQDDERALRGGADVDGARVLDLALRAAAAGSRATGLPPLRWVEAGGDEVLLVLASSAPPPRGFTAVAPDRWLISGTPDELAAIAGQAEMPAPTLIPVGTTSQDRELLVELEASGVVTVVGPPDETVGLLRALSVAIATAPWSEQSRVLLVGLHGQLADLPWVTPVSRLAEAIEAAESHVDRTTAALWSLRCQSTAQARAAGITPEAWESLVVVSAVPPNELGERQRVAAIADQPRKAVAMVTPSIEGTEPVGRTFTIGADGWLRIDGVEPAVWPHRLEEADAGIVVALLDLANQRQDVPADTADGFDVRRPPAREPVPTIPPPPAPGAEPIPWPGPDATIPPPPTDAEPAAVFTDPAAALAAGTGAGPATDVVPEPELGGNGDVDDELASPAGADAEREAAGNTGAGEGFAAEDRARDATGDLAEAGAGGARSEAEAEAGGRRGTSEDAGDAGFGLGPEEVPAALAEGVEVGVTVSGIEPVLVPDPEPLPVRRLDDLMDDVDVLVRVLGEVQAVRRGEEPGTEERLVPVRQKALEAIAYLALRESAVDREDLEINLFPDGANAAKTIYNTVSAARALVGEELFPPIESGRYVLSERVVTDYGLFCDLVAQADETDDALLAADLLTDALTLVRGEPFTGVGRGYAWVGPHRGMIVAQVVDAAEELAEVRLAMNDWRSAEWAARRGLRAFPSDERMYRLLMRAARAAGNVPGVQRVFRELCDVIADPDLGVEPEDTLHPETIALLEELTGVAPRRGQMGA